MSDEQLPAKATNEEEPQTEVITEEVMADLLSGDIASLTRTQRNQFLWKLAKGLNLNPLTKPFDLIVLNNKLTVYANRTAADQLARNHGISMKVFYQGPLILGYGDKDGTPITRDDVYMVQLVLSDKDGREETSTGCVGIGGLQGEALGNAIMKCHTKAKRRGVLAMCGLGFLDEMEVASVAQVAKEQGKPGPRRFIPPPDVTASSESAEKSGPTTVVLPPTKGPQP
jgi:hypothetical protein